MATIHAWLIEHYHVLHDFAAPVATIIAASVAVFVTWQLGRGQLRIAEQQANIARQQAKLAAVRLRHDLYDRRFAVFEYARDLIFHTETNRDMKREHYQGYIRGTLNAVFLLDSELVQYLEELRSKANRLRFFNAEFQRLDIGEERTKRSDQIEKLMEWFIEQYPILVDKFKPFLRLYPPT